MNRAISGLVILAIGVGSWACKGDPQGSLNRGDAVKILAAPTALFIDQGETELILVEVLDEQGNQLGITDFAMTSNNPGVTVVEDTTFNLVYDAQGNATRPSPWTRARFEVTGVNTVGTTVTASGGGLTLDIPVRVVPVNILAPTISNANPVLGEEVTITFPSGVVADPATTTVSFPSSPTPVNVVVDPAGTSITFLPGPNTAEAATISNLSMTYASSVPPFSLDTEVPITTPAITEVPVTWSNASPIPGEIVRMTAGAGFQFSATSTVVSATFSTLIDAVDPGGTFIDLVFPIGGGGFELVSGVISTAAPQFPLTVPTDVPINSVPATPEPFAGTDDPATAPTLTLPTTSGTTVNIYDAGVLDATNGFFGFPTRWYNIVVPATTTYDITVEWSRPDGEDLGLYLLDTGLNILDAADNNGGGSGAQPETATITLTAGNYIWANLSFGGTTIGATVFRVTAQ
jgi:hypothetical protein